MRELQALYHQMIALRAKRDAALLVISGCRENGSAIPQDQQEIVTAFDRCLSSYQAMKIKLRLERHCQGEPMRIAFLGPERFERQVGGHRKNPNQVNRSLADLARRRDNQSQHR